MDQTEEYVKRILKVVIYIESNLDETLTIGDLARIACYSPFHFHRIFHAFVGETLHQYVKRLRLERAAGKLRYTNSSVTEIALDANFNTPSAFTRAFKQFMSESSKNYRDRYAAFNEIVKTIEELPMLKPEKIEKNMPDFEVLFIRKTGNYSKSPWEAWKAMSDFIEENRLEGVRRLGIAHDDPEITDEERLRFDACILGPESGKIRGEIGRQVIKGGKYGLFMHYGPYKKIFETYNKIFLKWLPESGEKFDESRPPFCEYLNMNCISSEPEKLITKVYIPLK